MMFVNKTILKKPIVHRYGFSMMSAFMFHALILIGFLFPFSKKMITADTYSAPTNVTIRFTSPVKEPQKIVKAEPVKPKAVQKKIVQAKKAVKPITPQELNNVQPASAPPPSVQKIERVENVQPPKEIIPVVSGDNIKGRRVQPQYPQRALRMRQEGVVWLRVLISETGARQDLKLHKPSQYAVLNQAAIKAVKKWTFDPNIVQGRAVKSWVEIPIEFKIQ